MRRNQRLLQAKDKLWDYFFGVLLVIAIGLWVWLNLHYRFVNDHDSAKVMYHTIRMWEEKTLLIPGWKYMTTAEWDCSALPAVLLYGMTGDIVLSFALSNIIHLFVFTCILLKLHQNIGLHGKYAFITGLAILIPFSFGMLNYANMLFYGAAQYIYKTLLPIWMIELLTAPEGALKKTGWRLQLLAYSMMVFLTAISSGIYVFLCGLFPLVGCTVVFMLREEHVKLHTERIVVCAVSGFWTVCGYVLQKVMGLSTYADQMNVVTLQNFFPKLAQNFTNLMDLTRALPEESISLYSMGGIMFVVRFIFLLCVLYLGLKGTKGWFDKRRMEGADSGNRLLFYASASMSGIFIWNIFVQQISVSTARYHIIGYVPLLIAAGIVFAVSTEKSSALIRFAHFSGAAAVLLIMMVGCWNSIYSAAGNYFRYYYDAVEDLAEEQGTGSVVFINDSASAEIARVFDLDRIYVSYFTSNRSLSNYDADGYYDDRSALDERHLLIASELGDLSDLPEYLQHGYQKVGEVFGDEVYMAQSCWLDGVAGPMAGRITTDYPYTQGYFFDAGMTERGKFEKGESRTVVQSPSFSGCLAPVKVTIYYQMKDCGEGAWININIEDTDQCIDMMPDGQWIEFVIPAEKVFSFTVSIGKDTELYVDRIAFEWL